MVEDLSTVATIPGENLDRLSELLQQQTGFLTAEALAVLVSNCIADESQGAAAYNALQNLSPNAIPQVLATVESWRSATDQNRHRFPDERYAALQENLRALIREYPALDRMRKASRLRVATGNEFEGVAFICDARPVYNEARDDIEGLIALTTMKIVYQQQNQLTEEIEFVLTAEQLDDLIVRAKRAQDKLKVLRRKTEEWLPGGCVEGEG